MNRYLQHNDLKDILAYYAGIKNIPHSMTSQSNQIDERLGTLELCTALNGNDPIKALSYMKRFIKTVRHEKIEALCEECDMTATWDQELEGQSDDDELYSLELQQPPSKKAKVEEWKLDTKSYNVPFVGTSTYKGRCGVVKKGTWPTGFLYAYLQQSPKAIEILGSEGTAIPLVPPNGLLHQVLLNRKHSTGKIISDKIFELYIQAVGELASCRIPLTKLILEVNRSTEKDEEYDDGTSGLITAKLEKKVEDNALYEQVISVIMKEHLSNLFNVLNNECNNSEKRSFRIIRAVLETLSSLALTSTGATREVIREFDNRLKDGVLQRLIASSFCGYMNNKSEERNKYKLEVQAALLHLASIIIESGDEYAIFYAISQGVKEAKTKPGIAFLLIRRIVAAHIIQIVSNSEVVGANLFLRGLKRFYLAIRSNILSSNADKETSGRLSSNCVVSNFAPNRTNFLF